MIQNGDIYIYTGNQKEKQGLGNTKCIQSEENSVLGRDDEIKEMWKNYCDKS